MCCSNGLESLLPAYSIIFNSLFMFLFLFFVGFPGGVWGGPTWHRVSLVPDFSAKCATSSCGLFEGGGLFGHACLCCQTSVPHVQPPSLWVNLWAIWGGQLGRACLCRRTSVPHALLRLTAYYAQQRVLCVTRTRVLKAVDENEEIGSNRQ